MSKYIFIFGGVISGLGKGITAASIGRLLMGRGYRVTNIKIDAYVNIDAGTMNPTEHGEVFVTSDGIETDQDIGNYERFLGRDMSRENYATTGQIFRSVIEKERNLEYGGKCVEVVPHIPMEIIERIERAAKKDNADITIVEIGGTVGEYQNILFIEAARMMKYRAPKEVISILVSFAPIPKTLGEMKTKPTQYASRTLNETGIQADFIICRGERPLDKPRKERIALLCNMPSVDEIISAPDVDNIYTVPLILKEQNLDTLILKKLGLSTRKKDLREWKAFIRKVEKIKKEINIAVLGKYFSSGEFVLADVYVSVIEAIKHGCWEVGVKPVLTWIDSDGIELGTESLAGLSRFDGVVVPGGFGIRGAEGIISAIGYVRENRIPFLGLCYGMQLAAVEFARNSCGLEKANTTEIDPDTPFPIIHLMPDQLKKLLGEGYGGTMRLGSYPCKLLPGSLAEKIYCGYPKSLCEKKEQYPTTVEWCGSQTEKGFNRFNGLPLASDAIQEKDSKPEAWNIIYERHRHRYEFNNEYRNLLESAGMVFSGTSPDGNLVEIIELPPDRHPFFIGVQFHPEFCSRPLSAHPVFREFARAAGRRAGAI